MSQSNTGAVRKELPQSFFKLGLTLVIVGGILGLIGFAVDLDRGLVGYLLGYLMIISVSVGALFLVSLEYIAGAEWSTPLRRVIEFFAGAIPLLAILVIPLLFGSHNLFEWTHKEVVAKDAILTAKQPYLNTTFFYIRVFGSIGLWSVFYFLMIGNSNKQDATGDQNLTRKNIKLSAGFIPIFAITISMTAIDWMMSVSPHWFSTIFGVYFFAGCVLSGVSAVTLATLYLKDNGYLHAKLNNDHLYSLGGLLFAFINFWAYIAFSQFMLIWYGNLPEETFWFLQRWHGNWMWISLLLIVIHFLVPYIVLLPQPAKKDPKKLKFAAIWILFAHLFDMYWLVAPSKFSGVSWTVIFEIGFPIAAAGFLILVFYVRSKKSNLTPVGDPKLDRALNFHL